MDAKAARRRWFWPTPAWLVYGAAAATGVLFACERWRWFPVRHQKGWPVLAAVAVVGAVLVLLPVWMLAGLLFRRRVQFSLATLLVFVTLCAMVCSWLAVRIKQARRQAEEVAAMQKICIGGPWYYPDGDEHYTMRLGAKDPEPEALRKMLGVDFFEDVRELWLDSPHLAEADMARIAVFTRLELLWLDGDKVTDAGLSHLKALSDLRKLDLLDTKVTEEGVKKLQRALPECKIEVVHTPP